MNPGDDRFSESWLRNDEFGGFLPVSHLRRTRCAEVPQEPGVYLVVRAVETEPQWLETSPGGHFKGRDPTVPVSLLKQRLIRDTAVLYIGKGDLLRRRLDQYIRFGAGAPIGHWGGRYIWQLADSDDLLIAWQLHDQPRARESELLAAFVSRFGQLPLANLTF